MALTHRYVRQTNGSDAADGLTHATAWKTIQYALDNITDGGGGQVINIADETGELLSTIIDFVGYDANVAQSADNPLIIRGYTATTGDGGIGEVNGNNAIATLFNQPLANTIFADLKLHNTTSYIINNTNSHITYINCEITNGGGSLALVDDIGNQMFIGCHIHNGGAGVNGLEIGAGTIAIGNYIHDVGGIGIRLSSARCHAFNNVVADVDEHGIALTRQYHVVWGNTVVGNGTDNMDGIAAIDLASELSFAVNNIIKDWNGTSAIGLSRVAGFAWLAKGHNHFHTNTSNEDVGDVAYDFGNDQTTDPTFTDAASGDFSVGANAKAKGWPTSFPGSSTNTYIDTGAAQRQEPAGGGGGSRRSRIRMHGD